MRVGSFPPPYHLLFESIAYSVSFLILKIMRKNDPIRLTDRSWVIAGGIAGAAIGAKLISWLDDPTLFISQLSQLHLIMAGGKGVVGALVGGWVGVEITKKRIGLRESTGDLFVLPLIVGMVIGRIGCFVTGLYDQTYGSPTSLPWGYDFGDDIPRHPAQIYEILFLLGWGAFLHLRSKKLMEPGQLFKFFMIGYLSFRFLVEFIKPVPRHYLGLDAVQITAIVCLFYLRRHVLQVFRPALAGGSAA